MKSPLWLLPAAALVFGGPGLYVAMLNNPTTRSMPLLFAAIGIAGAAIALVHAIKRRKLSSFLAAGVLELVALFFLIGTTVLARVPHNSGVPSTGAQAPIELAVVDSSGKKLTIAEALGGKPKIVVFFRGVW